MRGALEACGKVSGVLADSLEKTTMNREHRNLLLDGQLVLISPYDPSAGFNVGNAMQRNKLIYALPSPRPRATPWWGCAGAGALTKTVMTRHRTDIGGQSWPRWACSPCFTAVTVDEPHRHVEVELIEHLAPFESDDDADFKPLSEKGRGIIVSAGRALLAEMENIQNTAMLHDTETYDAGWDEGLQEGLAEARRFQERLQVAEKELPELRRKPPVVASPAKPEAIQSLALSERMGALLAPVQAPV